MKLTKRLLALALTVPLFLVTACDGNDTPEQTPSPESSSSASETPNSGQSPDKNKSSPATTKEYKPATLEHPAQNVPVPKYPEAGKKDDKKGREAAANYFMDAILYAKETGSSEAIDKVAYPECPECWVYQRQAEKFYKANAWIVGGIKHSRKFLEMPGPDQYGQYQLQFKVLEDGGTLVYPPETNRKPKKEKPVEAKGILYVQYWPEKGKNVIMKYQTTSLEETP